MKKQVLFPFLLLSSIILSALNGFTQSAPAITYNSPRVFNVGTAVNPLSPINTGGALFPGLYSNPLTFVNSNTPFSIAIDKSNNIYATNNSTGDLTKYNAAGNIIFTINTGSTQASEVAVDNLGNIYVSQFTTNSILKYNAAGQLIATISDFNDPYGIAFDASNNAYVADYLSGEIIKIAVNDTVATTYASGLTTPYGVIVDASGNLYVSEQSVGNVIKIAAGSLTQSVFATGFNGPRHLSKDGFGNIYVADYDNNAVKRISPDGIVTNLIPSGLNNPRQAAFDSDGNLFIADFGSNTLQKSTASVFSISEPLPTGLNFDITTGEISGIPGIASALKNYIITASNTGGINSTTLAIGVIDSAQILTSKPTINIFPPSSVTTSTATISGITNVNSGVPTVTITYGLTANLTNATTITIPVGGNSAGANVVFNASGLNPASTYYYKITSTNSSGTVTSAVSSFTTLKNTDATLATLTASQGSFFPAFSHAVSTYADTVSNAITGIQLTAASVDSNSTISVNGANLNNGKSSAPVNLNVGNNIIIVTVTAQDGVTTSTYTLNVYRSKTPQTIKFSPFVAKTYGDKDFAPDAVATSGETVAYSSDNASVASIVNDSIHIVGAGTAHITAMQAGNTTYTAAANVIQSLTVSKAPLTITVNNNNIAYGDPIPSFTMTYSGFVNNDDPGKLAVFPIINTTVTANSPAGTYPVTSIGAASNNYVFTYQQGKLTIGQNNSNITFAAIPAKTYGDADFSLTSVSTSGLPVTYTSSDNTVAVITGNTVHIVGAGSVVITASQNGNANYATANSVTQTFTVNKAALSVTANNMSITYGSAIPALTVTYKGFVNNDNATKLTAQPVITTTATSASVTGVYAIAVSGTESANYNITYTSGILTIGQNTSIITFAPIATKTYGDADFNLPATASSGLPVSYTSSNNSVAIISGNTVHIVGAGSVVITASQSGDANFSAAANVNQTIIINKASISIAAIPQSKTYGSADPAATYKTTTGALFNGDTFNGSLTRDAGEQAGTYAYKQGTLALNNNYILNFVSDKLTISKAQLIITANNNSIAYGAAIPSFTVTYNGFVNGDDPGKLAALPVVTTTALVKSPAGTYPLTPSGAAGNNYIFNYQSGTLTIGQNNSSITFALIPAKTYGDADFTLTSTSTSGLPVTYASGNTAVATISGNTVHIIGAGTAIITASQSGNANFATASNVIQALTINKAALSVSANDASIVYGSAIPALTVTYKGFVNGDAVAQLTTQATATTTATSVSSVGTYPVKVSGAASSNYNFTYTPGILTIGQSSSTISFASLTPKTYGDANFNLSATASSGLPIAYTSSNNTIATISGNTIHIIGAGSVVITATQGGNANIAAAKNVTQTFTVNKALLTVTANNININYGQAIPALTVSYSGFVSNDSPGKLAALPAVTTNAVAKSPAGIYPITPIGAASNNYIFTYQPGTLAIGQNNSNIIFAAIPAKTYGDADFNLSATASSGLPVTYISSDNSVATITGNTVHIVSAGTIIITASQNGNNSFAAATNVNQTLVVYKAGLTIIANDVIALYGQKIPALTITYKGFVNGDNAAKLTTQALIKTDAVMGFAAGRYSINIGGAVSNNYWFNYQPGTLIISPNISTINFAAIPAKFYGDADFNLSANASSGLQVSYASSNNAVAIVSGNMIHIVGTGTTIITASQSGSSNFTPAANVNQIITVNKAPLTVIANNINLNYGQAIPALTISYNGFVNGDDASKLTSPVIVKTNAVTGSAVGKYPIIVSGAISNNYTFDYQPGTLTINPNSSTITFAAIPAKTYGDTDFDLTSTSTSSAEIKYSISNNTVATIKGNTVHIVGAGTAVITASQNGNIIAGVTQTLRVNKAQLNIAANDASIFFNSAIPSFTAAYSGFVNGETTKVLIKLPEIKVAAISGSPIGKYSINISGAESNNYAFTYKAGILTISLNNVITAIAQIIEPIIVHQAVSPNGDGINDFLLIQGIQNYPNNRVSIIDRSGAVIAQIVNYDNTKKVFDGHSNINGSFEKPGTYYYKIDYVANKENKSQTGFFVLKY